MVIGINCGHTVSGQPGCGAMGYLNESNETRAVGYELMRLLRAAGHTVVDCTDDYASSTSENLRQICSLANSRSLDMFISIHFNASGGKGSEVFTAGAKDTARAKAMQNALVKLGFTNRGVKDGSHLYVIRRTNAPAALIETCFVDTQSDAQLYKKIGYKKVAEALAEAITGKKVINEEELTMTQYEELKNELENVKELAKALNDIVYNLNNPMIYNYIDDNMPEWARPSVQKAVDKGIIKGEENGLNLTYSDLRSIVREDRAGLFD